ncbi:CHAT domain-containing protein [Actinomadura macra]|uniref:CHAT domain-containing protein n=1 Tax=Actinomadura macra TaxID=46164 RepID=UPI000AB5FA4F|nr:CHAT domain-containing protein [Actinomadura macra]
MSAPGERALLRLAAMAPTTARTRALTLLERAVTASEEILALRVAGLAAKELGHLDEGLGHLRHALDLAEGRRPPGDRDAYAAAQVRMNLVGLLAARGECEAALAHASEAEPVLSGPDADRLAANRACVLARAGRVSEAHDLAARALPRLRHGNDPATLSGLLTNLGLARALRGDFDDAEQALAEAVAVGEAAGLRHQTAMAKGNMAFVVSRRGDVPRALRLFAEAEPQLTGERLAQCRFDQAETLIVAGLPGEARPVLEEALAAATANGYRCDVADGLLLLAHAELADGLPGRAAGTAERARDKFAGQERTGWMLLAEHVLLRARWVSGERSEALLDTAVATAEGLDDCGWSDAAADARIVAARVAIAQGRPAGDLLRVVGRMRGPAAAKISAWHAIALERSAKDDHRGAIEAVQAGLRVTEEHAEVLGALDLRARAAGFATELAELGLSLAGSAQELLALEERRRVLARPVRVRPPKEPGRAAALAALRALSVEHTADTARGGVPSVLSEDLVALEAQVMAHTRRRTPDGLPSHCPDIGEIAAALDGRALVELVAIGPELHAVTVTDGRVRRRRLGPWDAASHDIGMARFALRRLAADEDDPQAVAALVHSSTRLERLLLAPLRADLGDRELVIAPTGLLHGLPWATLPFLAGRPFTVAPSAGAWLRACAVTRPTGHVVLASGPDLMHTARELDALRRVYPHALVLDGPGARAEHVRDAMDGALLAHIAAHGEFRPGNALFSLLRLADGPLMVHDLDGLSAPPHVMVLSACDIGRADEGDAVLGMAGVLLALGTATVIASVAPVRDEVTPEFMSAFHAELAGGRSPARALASVRRSPGVAGFLCLGAG